MAATLAHMAQAQAEQQRSIATGRQLGGDRSRRRGTQGGEGREGSSTRESRAAEPPMRVLQGHVAQLSRADLSAHQCVFVPSRSYVKRADELLSASATRIQARWRGVLGRELARARRGAVAEDKMREAAARIQAAWRGRAWRRSVALEMLRRQLGARREREAREGEERRRRDAAAALVREREEAEAASHRLVAACKIQALVSARERS